MVATLEKPVTNLRTHLSAAHLKPLSVFPFEGCSINTHTVVAVRDFSFSINGDWCALMSFNQRMFPLSQWNLSLGFELLTYPEKEQDWVNHSV